MTQARPRILFVNRFYRPDESATAQMLTQLAEHVQRMHGNVEVIAGRGFYQGGASAETGVIGGVLVHRVGSSTVTRGNLIRRAIQSIFLLLSFGRAVHRHARKGDVVVALTDPPLLGTFVWLAARARGARIVHWQQDVFPEVATALLPRIVGGCARVLAPLRDAVLGRSDAVVAIGELMGEYLAERAGGRTRVHVIGNWANDDFLRPLFPPGDARRSRGVLPHVPLVVGYQGNLGRAHDGSVILEAATLLRHTEGIRFVLTGGGAGFRTVRSEATERGLRNMEFRDYVPESDLNESLSVPDVHLISLRPQVERFIVPSKLYAALAVGRGVVFLGDRNGEVAQILCHARAGETVQPDNNGYALAAVLHELLTHPGRVHEWGANARAYLDSDASRARSFGKWEELIASLNVEHSPAT